MREKLLAYLLDELDESDRKRVEEAMRMDEGLLRECECLRMCIEPDPDDVEITVFEERENQSPTQENPRMLSGNLAAKTCKHVAETTWSAGSFTDAESVSSGNWKIADVLVAVGIVFAMGMFLMPAMLQSRNNARRLACQNNLGKLVLKVREYANVHGGLIPQVPAEGKDAVGGIYAVELVDSEIISRRRMVKLQLCPSSDMAARLQRQRFTIRLPSRIELLATDGQALKALQDRIGGSYAFRVGYMQKNVYQPIRMNYSSTYAIMSDAPGEKTIGYQSRNHGESGLNVAFADGHVTYVTNCKENKDNFFTNHKGYRAAGTDMNDTVLLPSAIGPSVHFANLK